jgi:hypothetical protein
LPIVILIGDVAWSTSFDKFCVIFCHSKTDQARDELGWKHHIYSNPKERHICPGLSLAFHFSCNYSTGTLGPESKLFPGPSRRFSDLLRSVLVAN